MHTFNILFVLVTVVLLGSILSAIAGAIAGLMVGMFFSNAILPTFEAFGVTGLSMWKLGATLGFVGGFFRSPVTKG